MCDNAAAAAVFLCHLDKNPTNTEQATERFKSVAEAYDVLSHPTKRTEYDGTVLTEYW